MRVEGGGESRRAEEHRCVCLCVISPRLSQREGFCKKKKRKEKKTLGRLYSAVFLPFFSPLLTISSIRLFFFFFCEPLHWKTCERHLIRTRFESKSFFSVFFFFCSKSSGSFLSPSNELRGGAAPSLPLRRRSFGPFSSSLNISPSFFFINISLSLHDYNSTHISSSVIFLLSRERRAWRRRKRGTYIKGDFCV